MQMAGRPLFGTDDSPDVRPGAGDLPRNWQAGGGRAAQTVRSAALLLNQSISARLSAEPIPTVNCGNIGEDP